jgi:CHAT domain-containing protein
VCGVRTLIGTLWEAEVDASRVFFTSFYTSLLAAPEDVTGAFGTARDATRTAFPAYRDWGAFYLMGAG